MDFLSTYHPLWLILAAIIAFLYSFFLYRKDALLEEVKAYIKWMLAVYRFVSVFLILVLILGIILENLIDRKEKPIVFVVNDNSASILLNKDSIFYKTKYLTELNSFSDELASNFEVINYDFSEGLTPEFSGDYSGKLTDISSVFTTIFDQYTNRNIGGIVLATDGIYNTGANPIYAIGQRSFLPIFTVGLGDTTSVRDVRVDRVNHNEIAFLGNEFPVEIDLSATKCANETVTLSVYEDEKLIKQEKIRFNSDEQQTKVQLILRANKIGFRKYRAEVSPVENEYSNRNNTLNFYVEVIDGRQKILLAHQSPHPDISALMFVVDNNKNYEVVTKRIEEISDLSQYDLIIVHNYVNKSQELNSYISEGKGAVLFVVGEQTDMQALEKLNIGFSGRVSDTEDVYYSHNPNQKEIILAPNTIQVLSNAPPLKAPFGNLKFSDALEVLAYQKVGSISLDQPLIYFTKKQESRMGVIWGDGIWRWRLFDQMRTSSTANFNDFFGKIITYLAVKENKDPFKVQLLKEYTENEEVIIKAELYNQSYDKINDPEVKFSYKNEQGETYESYFVKTGNAYSLNLGRIPQGIYTWQASTSFQGKKYLKEGSFLVKEVKLEYLNSVANHRILKSIASKSGGSFHLPSQLKALAQEIKTREDMVTVVYQEKQFDDLIDYKWLFFLVVILFSVEWFVRKFQGAY